MLDSPPPRTSGKPTPASQHDPFDAFNGATPIFTNSSSASTVHPSSHLNASAVRDLLSTSLNNIQKELTAHFQEMQVASDAHAADIHNIIAGKLDALYNQELPYITQTLTGMRKSIDALFSMNKELVKEIADLKAARLVRSGSVTSLGRRSPVKVQIRTEGLAGERTQLQTVEEAKAGSRSPSPQKRGVEHTQSRSLDTATGGSPSRSKRHHTRGQFSQASQAQSAPATVESHPNATFTLPSTTYSGASHPSAEIASQRVATGRPDVNSFEYHWSPALPPSSSRSATLAHAAAKAKDKHMTPPSQTGAYILNEAAKDHDGGAAAYKAVSDAQEGDGEKVGAKTGDTPEGKRSVSYKDYFTRLGRQRGEPDVSEHPAFREE